MQQAYLRKKRLANAKKLKDYFDDDEDDSSASAAPPFQSHDHTSSAADYDPLEAFMMQNNAQLESEQKLIAEKETVSELPEIVSEQERDYESFFDSVDNDKHTIKEVEYDSDGVPVGTRTGDKSRVEPLPPVDHASIKYIPFNKSFYHPHEEVAAMSEAEVSAYRRDHEIAVTGTDIPRPLRSFMHAGFPSPLLREIVKVGYEAPTPIQAQALPAALSGRDIIGLAKTGSGKTLSFLWPMIIHILDQPQMELGDGPIGLVLSPTRELTTQIYSEAKKFAKVFNIRVCAVYGGEGKWQMAKALKEAPEIVIATPGRLMELISNKSTNLKRCTMVVLDEADRMFELGFEYQMRSIVNNIRPDRQTLLFSATMKKKIEGFAREVVKNPIRIVIGSLGQSNPDIKQIVEIVPEDAHKWPWLACRIEGCIRAGKVLIFVSGKADTETLASELARHFEMRQVAVGVECIHGDKDQTDRTNAIKKFKSGSSSVLVATDVASRGLDIKDVRTVINYNAAKNIETHVHRIGRTGRMGIEGVVPGVAYTLLSRAASSDRSFSVSLVKNLRDAGQNEAVTSELLEMAQSDPQWSRVMNRRPGGGNMGRGSGGLGFVTGGQGGGHQKAMTSSMLASQSKGSGGTVTHGVAVQKAFEKIMGGAESSSAVPSPASIQGDVAANPYIEGRGMGRGKHMTQPSWSSSEQVKVEDASPISDPPVKKRKSRFAGLFEAPQLPAPEGESSAKIDYCPPSQAAAPTPQSTPLPGFVRAASSSGTSLKSVSEINKSNVAHKRSRWN
mmetsp:Transcript_15877/g.23910  ORF Transcript_15877/g.23910 Transcript_15877/m.23910 type:complete len:785 (-) Transcript_15877:35-2389(-)